MILNNFAVKYIFHGAPKDR